jgi:uncharacterized protein
MKNYNLPTRSQCLNLMQEHHVPAHVRQHSLTVAKLAVFLATKLRDKGIAINIDLVDRACLLHDLFRLFEFRESDYDKSAPPPTEKDKEQWEHLRAEYKGLCHEDAAYDLLKQKYPALALTIKRHRYAALLDEQDRPHTWEEKLVYYADKRVMHDKIVPLKKRLEEAHKRNVHLHRSTAQSKLNAAKIDPLIFKLEQEIFSHIGLNPHDVTDEFINSQVRSETSQSLQNARPEETDVGNH